MAGPYSTDLRSRVLTAMEEGESPTAAAKRFAVGRSTAYRWMQAAHDEGRREAIAKRSHGVMSAEPTGQMGGGPAPRIDGAIMAALLDLLRGEDNHLTLEQCRDPAQIASRFR
jgi:transposase